MSIMQDTLSGPGRHASRAAGSCRPRAGAVAIGEASPAGSDPRGGAIAVHLATLGPMGPMGPMGPTAGFFNHGTEGAQGRHAW